MTAPAVRAGQLDELAPADRGLAVDEKAAGAAGGGELDVEAGLVVVPQGPADALVVPSVEQHGLDHDMPTISRASCQIYRTPLILWAYMVSRKAKAKP
jgi:hypothetical protein